MNKLYRDIFQFKYMIFHIFTFAALSSPSSYGYLTSTQRDQLLVSSIAQLIGQCTRGRLDFRFCAGIWPILVRFFDFRT